MLNKPGLDVDPQLMYELHGKLKQIKPQQFLRKLMYRQVIDVQNAHRYIRDKDLAEKCAVALGERGAEFDRVVTRVASEDSRTRPEVLAGIPSLVIDQGFTELLSTTTEAQLYAPLVSLFEFIKHFFRAHYTAAGPKHPSSNTIDHPWPSASPPNLPEPRKTRFGGAELLRRRFVDTHQDTFSSSKHVKHPPPRDLHPDISMILHKDVTVKQLVESNHPPWKDSGGRVHWKDVKVPIEVKVKGFRAAYVCQLARYAKGIKTEQFDRNFAFSLLVTSKTCHIFHWGASRCHVAEVDITNDTATFIQIIGRLASMDPPNLGYDPRFSNAGRVLAKESATMDTVLEVASYEPDQLLQAAIGGQRQ
ncbi:hypothetical protein FRB90_008206 [Tulasnella sp. 427]|nr:hypothetical protein FRB90_008206 [Tulasnella sp. 427]